LILSARLLLIIAILVGLSELFLARTVLTASAGDSGKQAVERAADLWKSGDADAAIASLQKTTESGGPAEAYHLLGQIYFKAKKKPREAAEAFTHALKLKPAYPDALNDSYLDLARLYESRHDIPAAMQVYQRLLTVRPASADGLFGLAMLYEGQGNNDAAREMLRRLTKSHPAHADGWYQAGRLAERNNDLLEAAYAYRQAIAAKPDLVDAHFNLGFIFRSQNKPSEAEREFLEVLRYRPEYAEAHMNLGVIYTSMNKLEEAEQEYEKAVDLKPDYAEAHYNLGVFYELHRKDMPRALAQYHKYRNLGGRDDRVERIIGTAGR
jgi:tetratricopeptide (TPR) repeat protein